MIISLRLGAPAPGRFPISGRTASKLTERSLRSKMPRAADAKAAAGRGHFIDAGAK